jgi:hypothetical protein
MNIRQVAVAIGVAQQHEESFQQQNISSVQNGCDCYSYNGIIVAPLVNGSCRHVRSSQVPHLIVESNTVVGKIT